MARDAEDRVSEATAEILKCVVQHFTGTLVIEFQDGVPMKQKKTDTKRFGRRPGRERLDSGSPPE